jgi:hypothetical protein
LFNNIFSKSKNSKTMTKHVLIGTFLLFFAHLATAQLTLQQVGGTKKRVIPVDTKIDLNFPTKTSGEPEAANKLYFGRLKNADKTSIGVVLTYENRTFTSENGVKMQLTRAIHPPDTPMIMQIPLTQLKSIVEDYPINVKVSNAGAVLLFAAIVSNLFIAPHLSAPNDKAFRNAGFIAMGMGISTAFIRRKKTYYFEQPKGGNKTLWQVLDK